jgi:hypothetical protein
VVRAQRPTQDRHPAELLVGLERAIALDAALDLGPHAQRVGQAELEPACDPTRRHAIVEQLIGIRCPSTIRQPGMSVLSCPDAIARVIAKVKNHAENGKNGSIAPQEKVTPSAQEKAVVPDGARLCPECSHELESDGGCIICRNCGYSKCN